MSSKRRQHVFSLVAVVAATTAFAACSGDQSPNVSSPDSILAPSTDTPAETDAPAQVDLPPDVSASGVVLAATLLATGKIDDAVASGLVTPAEVDEARAAIESGTLQRWVDIAEGK